MSHSTAANAAAIIVCYSRVCSRLHAEGKPAASFDSEDASRRWQVALWFLEAAKRCSCLLLVTMG